MSRAQSESSSSNHTAMKVGELARRTGLTVRTLHYYDEVGLLRPSRRTVAGHRRYLAADVERLQQVMSLRQIGLSLEEIQRYLDRPGVSLEQVLELHLSRLREVIAAQAQLCERLETIVLQGRGPGSFSIEALTEAIEAMPMFEKYYTPEQLEQLRQRGESVGSERIEEVQREWADLFARFREAMEAGADPASQEMKELARKSESLIAEFTGGDPGITASLTNMYAEQGGPKVLETQEMDVDRDLWEYMGKAKAALAST